MFFFLLISLWFFFYPPRVAATRILINSGTILLNQRVISFISRINNFHGTTAAKIETPLEYVFATSLRAVVLAAEKFAGYLCSFTETFFLSRPDSRLRGNGTAVDDVVTTAALTKTAIHQGVNARVRIIVDVERAFIGHW